MDARDFPLSPKVKSGLVNAIGYQPDATDLNDSYIQYYRRVVVESNSVSGLTSTHSQIINLIQLLKTPAATRDSIIAVLQTRLRGTTSNDETLTECTNLAVRLFLMVSTGSPRVGHSIAITGETHLDWKEDSIQETVSKQFQPNNAMKDPVKLEKIFTVGQHTTSSVMQNRI